MANRSNRRKIRAAPGARRSACSAPARHAGAIAPGPASGSESENVLTEALVLRDPDIPVAGNAAGDITIVEYFDYQCPYCRKVEPELRQVMHEDGKVRLVLKDWPILGPMSVTAARMALASKYQDKFAEAHDALIGDQLQADRAENSRGCLRAPVSISIGWTAISPATKGDRRDTGPQQRSGDRVRIPRHACLHRRQIPRAGRADHGAVHPGNCRRKKSGRGKEIAASRYASGVDLTFAAVLAASA